MTAKHRWRENHDKKLIVFIDSGDTLVNEGTGVQKRRFTDRTKLRIDRRCKRDASYSERKRVYD